MACCTRNLQWMLQRQCHHREFLVSSLGQQYNHHPISALRTDISAFKTRQRRQRKTMIRRQFTSSANALSSFGNESTNPVNACSASTGIAYRARITALVRVNASSKRTLASNLTPPWDDKDWTSYFLGEFRSRRKIQQRSTVEDPLAQKRHLMLKDGQRVVLVAMASNLSLCCFKLLAAYKTGSASMLAEGFHSFADVVNECLLMIGIRRSLRKPDPMHPYGFSKERYAWALISGVGVFFLGCGLSIYHGISGILKPKPIENVGPAFWVLGTALLFEGATAIFAAKSILRSARVAGVNFFEYVRRGADPTAVQVLLEDTAGVCGVIIAGTCLGLAQWTENVVFDPIGSLLIGGLLGAVAVFLIRRNISGLIETSMNPDRLKAIVGLIEADPIVRSVHDVKSTSLGPEWARFKAEILFDGEEVSRRYLHTNRSMIEKEWNAFDQIKSKRDMEEFLVRHGGGIVNQLGDEVDRLELEIRKRAPEVKHCDLEIL